MAVLWRSSDYSVDVLARLSYCSLIYARSVSYGFAKAVLWLFYVFPTYTCTPAITRLSCGFPIGALYIDDLKLSYAISKMVIRRCSGGSTVYIWWWWVISSCLFAVSLPLHIGCLNALTRSPMILLLPELLLYSRFQH